MPVALAPGTKVYLALAPVDMRKGFDGFAASVQQVLKRDPFCGQLFLFRSRRADRLKALWWDGSGLCLFAKRLERGRFVWPQVKEGAISLTPAQLAMLTEGLDWRRAIILEDFAAARFGLIQCSDSVIFCWSHERLSASSPLTMWLL